MLYLQCQINGEAYALPSKDIIEVLPLLPVRPLPKTPVYIAGILNYRAFLIPVIDLTMLLADRSSAPRASTRIVVVDYRQQPNNRRLLLGLIAEQATETLALDEYRFIPQVVDQPEAPWLASVDMSLGQPIQRIDAKEFLSDQVQSLLYPEHRGDICE